MIRRLIRRIVQEEDGIALVLAIASVSILAITTTGIIVAGTANETTAWVSTKQRAAFAVAQQALAYGEGMVYGDVEGSPKTIPAPDTWTNTPAQPGSAGSRTVSGRYKVTTSDSKTWRVTGEGTFGSVTRTVSAYVTPTQTLTSTQSTQIWDYGVFENDPVGSLSNCAISGGVVVSLPIYSRGNFCMSSGTSKILNSLAVGGKLLTTGGAQIGASGNPVPKLEVAGGCNANGSGYVTAGVNPCDGNHNSTYALSVGTTLDPIPPFPVVDYQAAYNAQQALTKSANCTSSGGACCPPNLFDNNTTMDNGDTLVTSSMFPSYSYQCTVGTNTINWTPAGSGASSLAVSGTLYFDGSLSTNKNIQYSGRASMYFTGGVTWSSGSGAFCAMASCASTWGSGGTSDPLIVWVTACTGISLTTNCVNLGGGGKFQVYVYTTGNYNVSGGSTNMGHVLCWDSIISGGSTITVSLSGLPPGTPTSSTTTLVYGTPPTGWSG